MRRGVLVDMMLPAALESQCTVYHGICEEKTVTYTIKFCFCMSELQWFANRHSFIHFGCNWHFTYYLVYNVLFYKFLAFTGVSSLFMTLVNLDRFAAICYPYQYVQYATAKFYVVIYISACLIFTLLICASFLFNPAYRQTYAVSAFFFVIGTCALTLTLCNWKICIVIRRHRREIGSVARNSSESFGNGPQLETKRHRIVVLLVVVFVFCKLPYIISRVILVALNMQYKMELEIFAIVSDILLVLNSLINPIVYCYRIQAFRSATKEVLCFQRKAGNVAGP